MTSLNATPKYNFSSAYLTLAAVSALAVTTALGTALPATAQVHPPVVQTDGAAKIAPALIGEPKGTKIAKEIEARVLAGRIKTTLGKTVSPGAREAARLAYAQGIFAPIWTRSAADKLMHVNPTFRNNGLDSGMTDETLRQAINNRFNGNAAQRAEGDLKLTATWLILTSKISGGLSDEGSMVRSTETGPTRSDLVVSLRQAGQSDPIDAMEDFTSSAPQYQELKQALKRYREHAANGGWMRIRDGKDMLEPGMDDPRVPALRKRLAAEGYVNAVPFYWIHAHFNMFEDESFQETASTVYDEALVDRVKAFQAAHGLTQDGVLGPATRAALNESVESKIDRVKRAMNHWRQSDDLGQRYIWVNIPSYRAEAWTGQTRDISMKTIVGKSRTPSTAFSDEIEYIVVNPKWFLPIGLFKRQKLRKLRKNPGYAAENNYNVYDRSSGELVDPYTIDWNKPGIARQIQMVQTPGPHNALGQLKIIFPNKHSVYLHDTPSRHLFAEDVRALSSGCIRLEDPVAMANWLTDGDQGVSTTVFNATLESRERERFHLDKHVQVHLTYLPAVVNSDGHVEFPADIYRNFKKPILANGVYSDDILESDNMNLFVENMNEKGPRTETLQ